MGFDTEQWKKAKNIHKLFILFNLEVNDGRVKVFKELISDFYKKIVNNIKNKLDIEKLKKNYYWIDIHSQKIVDRILSHVHNAGIFKLVKNSDEMIFVKNFSKGKMKIDKNML